MKYFICLNLLFLSVLLKAQTTETYYDYNWKPCDPLKARFYSTLQKTDSGWLRNDYFISGPQLQMRALYADSACTIYNGNQAFFYANGNASSIGRSIQGKNEGVCVSYHPNGMMSDSATYKNGVPVGYRLRWHSNGYLSDSIAHANDSMDVQISWFSDGIPASAGYLLYGELHGKWQFFHHNGKLAAMEIYKKGAAVSKEFYNEDGTVLTDTSKVNAAATFKGGMKGWEKYIYKNLYWPPGYKFAEGNTAVVVVSMVINEEGKPEEVEVVTPFHPAFDKIAKAALAESPKWEPAISHNRVIKSSIRQAVIFNQDE